MLEKFVLKYRDKAVYIITAFIVIVFAVIMITLFVNTGEKTPATYEQVNTELVNLGYEPVDSTTFYAEQSSELCGSIMADNGNVRFNFFEFDNNDSALNLFKNNHDLIFAKRSGEFHEWDEHYDNYAMYSMSSNGIYYISIWVGNTAIYAYCDEEYTSELGEILTAIGYRDS